MFRECSKLFIPLFGIELFREIHSSLADGEKFPAYMKDRASGERENFRDVLEPRRRTDRTGGREVTDARRD